MRRIIVLICSVAFPALMLVADPVGVPPSGAAFETAITRAREALALGRIGEANSLLQEACPRGTLASVPPARAGVCYHLLAVVATKDGRADESLELLQHAAEAWAAAGREYQEAWGNTQLILADLYQQRHQSALAEVAINGYLDKLSAKEQDKRPEALSRLALVYGDTGRPELGRKTALDSLAAFAALSVPRPAEAAYAHNTLGVISLSMGKQDEAESNLRKAVQLGIEALGEQHLDTAGYQTNLALALLARGSAEEAETLLRRARYVTERQPGASGNQLGMISAELSAVAIVQNKFGIAGEEARKALDILRRQQWPDRRAIALAQVNLADVDMHANRLAEAESLLNEAIPAERVVAPNSRLLADGVRRLAQLRGLQQRWREAADLYREAIGLYDLVVGVDNPAVAPLLREYADTLKRDRRPKAEIRDIEVRAKALLSFAPPNGKKRRTDWPPQACMIPPPAGAASPQNSYGVRNRRTGWLVGCRALQLMPALAVLKADSIVPGSNSTGSFDLVVG